MTDFVKPEVKKKEAGIVFISPLEPVAMVQDDSGEIFHLQPELFNFL